MRDEKQIEQMQNLSSLALKRVREFNCEATINMNFAKEYATRFSNSTVLQNYVDYNNVFDITAVYNGTQRASSRTNDLSEKSILNLVDYAVKIAKLVPPDPVYPGIPKEEQQFPKLSLNDPNAASIGPEDIIDKVESAFIAGEAVGKKVQGVSGNILLSNGNVFFSSSNDVEVIYPSTTISSNLNINAVQNDEESRSNSNFGSRILAKLEMEKEAKEVAERAVLGLNAQSIEPGEYEVLFDHQAASTLTFMVGFGTSSRMIVDRSSYLNDKIGQQVFGKQLSIENDPHNEVILSAKPIDDEGTATQKFSIVEDGVLMNYAYSRLDAARLGTVSNGCGFTFFGSTMGFPFALKMREGSKSKESMIADIDDGLIVTNLHYTNFVNPPVGSITGMTKDGVFRVKNGEIVGSVKNMRFTDEIPKFMKDIEVGSELRQPVRGRGGSGLVAPIKVKNFKFTSKTQH
ncbi:MAG: TldD/PmbA family protein [Candidatus Heimdallarchaeota archaeon]|nr:TldD/PmbA family protein [Candidatus Heimdallarchaeota archaeon]